MPATLSDLLKKMLEMSGSDLHVTTQSPPQVRVHGHLHPLDLPPLTPAETKQLAYSVLTDAQKHRFEERMELDFSFGIKGLARFRGNLFNRYFYCRASVRLPPECPQPVQAQQDDRQTTSSPPAIQRVILD